MFGTYRPDGEIDIATAQSFDAELRDAIDRADEALVVVDCSRVTFMDAAAYHVLARATQHAVQRGHTLVIRRMSPSCERLVRLCDPDRQLHVDSRSCAGLKSVDSSRAEGWISSTIVDLCGAGSEPRVRRSAPRVVIAGCPGAGKGTQGIRLARRLGVQHLSTGDLLRDAIATGSSLGRAVERLVRAGRLVPTGLIVAIVESSLDTRGYVLDGFPRTVAQAEALFERDVLVPNVTIEIVVPVDIALARLAARGRTDDDPGVARERLSIYETETVPVLALLERRALVVRVDGNDLPRVVEERVTKAFLCAHRSNERGSPANLRAVSSAPDRATVSGAGIGDD